MTIVPPSPMPVSGFTIVRNAILLDFPLEASIRSLLPACDEVVVAVGRSADGTLDLVRSLADPRIRILETDWDLSRGPAVLADQTRLAMQACRHSWGIYVQADEVLEDGGAVRLAEAIRQADAEPAVEGLLVDYLHFYGGFGTVAAHRRWYRREVRAIRLDPACDIRSHRDAQGFRVGPAARRIRARRTGVRMLHYGWARPPSAIRAKHRLDREIFPDRAGRAPATDHLPWIPGIRPFAGPHPTPARQWVEERGGTHEVRIAPFRFHWEFVRFWLSALVERVTGVPPFEYRNYLEV